MTRTAVDLHALDELLARCESSAGAMATNLLALDENPAFVLIRHTTFTGATARRFGAALAEVPTLWERAAAYADTVARARRLRDEHRRPNADQQQEIEFLLLGPSTVDPSADGGRGNTGLTGRTILGRPADGAVTLDALAHGLGTAYAAVTEAVRTIDACWQEQLPAVQAMQARLQRARADALALELDPDRELGDLPARAQDALGEVTTDPVGRAAAVQELGAAVTALVDRLAALAVQRDRLGADLAQAREELVALRLLLDRGAQAHERARAKVADPAGLREPLPEHVLDGDPGGLGPELDRVEAERGNWTDRRRALDAWIAHARAVRAEAQAVARANEAPVAARDELRGRLEAYRAMAAAHGASEDAPLEALYERARTALHTAPADLRAAAPLVVQYVAAVRARAGTTARKERP